MDGKGEPLMDKIRKYIRGACITLLITSFALLLYNNYAHTWLWLFLLAAFALLILIDEFVLPENHSTAIPVSLMQCADVLFLAWISEGYGSLLLLFIIQAALFRRYGKNSAFFSIFMLFLLCVPILILSPIPRLQTPSLFFILPPSLIVFHFMLLSSEEGKKIHRESLRRITDLEMHKKNLRDLNLRMEQWSRDQERLTILRERSRMSKEIHDTLGHTLTAISVQLGAAGMLVEHSPQEALSKITNARGLAREGLDNVRNTLSLMDEELLQFEDSLMDIVKKAQSSMGLRILPQIEARGKLPIKVQTLLLSALKEGITNGVRHGGASAFVFRLLCSEGRILFYLEDNGTGSETVTRGYGLTFMEKQAEECGGRLEAYTMKEAGFVLKLQIPLTEDDHD